MNAKTGLRASLMAAALVAVLSAGSLAGCAAPQWNSGVTAASKSIEAAAEQIGQYQKIGAISNETEDKLLDKLKVANGELRRADRLHMACGDNDCRSSEDLMLAVNAAVAEVTTELLKYAAEKARLEQAAKAKGSTP